MVLPVRQDDVYMGLAVINGLLRHENDSVILEYQLKDEVLGMFDSEMKQCKIPLNIIDQVEVEQKWFSGRFNIYLNRLLPMAKSIQVKENCISFKFKKKELDKAKHLKTRIMIELSEQKLRELDEDESSTDRPQTNSKKDPEPIEFREKEQTQQNPEEKGLKNMLRKGDRD